MTFTEWFYAGIAIGLGALVGIGALDLLVAGIMAIIDHVSDARQRKREKIEDAERWFAQMGMDPADCKEAAREVVERQSRRRGRRKC